jgi:hydrogenase assembly chaperone HypC/HupF
VPRSSRKDPKRPRRRFCAHGASQLWWNREEISLAYVPEANEGEYVIVRVGFAISVVDEAEALLTFEYLKKMGELAMRHTSQ